MTIAGINGPTSVSLQQTTAGSGYSIGCTGVFVTDYRKILPGQNLCVRHSASLQPGGTVETTVNVGGRSVTYTTVSTSVAADTVPDGYSFTDQTDVAPGTAVTSNTVTVTGLTGAAPIAVENGMYSIGCDPLRFVSSNGFITDGQTICVQHVASSQFNTTTRTTLAIGGVTDTFSSTTATADTTPNAFAFPAVSGVTPGSTVVSTAVVISGINAPTPVSVVTGEFSIGCVTGWTSAPGTILPGHTICVRHTAATQASSSVTTTLTIGGVSSGFTSTTAMQTSHGGGGGGGGGAAASRIGNCWGFLRSFSCVLA